MPKVIFSDSKGLRQESGSGIEFKDGSPTLSAHSVGASVTLTKGGHYTPTGGARTLTFPAAASVPGQMFVIRAATAHAHILTGSDSGVASFVGRAGVADAAASVGQGGKLTFAANAGNSVVLVSDGAQYLVMASSGTFTLSGYPN